MGSVERARRVSAPALARRLSRAPPAEERDGKPSQGPRAHLPGNIFGGAHGKSHDGNGRVLISAADEAAAVDDEEIPDIVALVPLVQHAGLRIVAHAAGTQFVDAFARRNRAVVFGNDFESRFAAELLASIGGMRG